MSEEEYYEEEETEEQEIFDDGTVLGLFLGGKSHDRFPKKPPQRLECVTNTKLVSWPIFAYSCSHRDRLLCNYVSLIFSMFLLPTGVH